MTKRLLAGCVLGTLGALSGCGGGFFIDTNASTTSSANSTSDYVYAVNQTSNLIDEFSLTGATLALISGSPVALPSGLAGSSVAVSRADTYVYVGGSQVISSYSIGTGGALTLSNKTAATGIQNSNFVSLDTSPDGKWLLALDSGTLTIYVFAITASTGALGSPITLPYVANGNGSGVVTPKMLKISPQGNLVAIALGTNGSQLFTFNTSTGVLVQTTGVPLTTGASDNAVAFDGTSLAATSNLFIARGGLLSGGSQILTYGITGASVLTASGSSIVSGNVPLGLLVESGGAYLYSANRGDSTVAGYSFVSSTAATTGLTTLAGSPYAFGSGGAPVALVEDKSNTYVVAVGLGGGKDVTLYTIGVVSPGVLSPVATATSGAFGITALAATH